MGFASVSVVRKWRGFKDEGSSAESVTAKGIKPSKASGRCFHETHRDDTATDIESMMGKFSKKKGPSGSTGHIGTVEGAAY